MKKIPLVAIVGRPNVGKSALFNTICRKRIAIVDEAEGITRDRLYYDSELFGRPFRLIDTGGIDARSKAPFNELVKKQAEMAIEEADSLIMVVDVRSGITSLDRELAGILLKTEKPVVLAVNKIDSHIQEAEIYPFLQLGFKKVIGVSALHQFQIAELCEAALAPFPLDEEEAALLKTSKKSASRGRPKQSFLDEEDADETPWDEEGLAEEELPEEAPPPKKREKFKKAVKVGPLKIAILGRPNVGKSSLINHLLAEERCIVSPIAGTTRDSIDTDIIVGGHTYTLIDTAGIRRKGGEKEVVDKFAAIRTERALSRCDICLLILSADEGITDQDKQIAQTIEESGKGCILLLNKWDLVKGVQMEPVYRDLNEALPFFQHIPKICISATTGRNCEAEKIAELIDTVYENLIYRISTGELNRLIAQAVQTHPPSMMQGGKRLHIYYATQASIEPPEIVLFVNNKTLLQLSYLRYLQNEIRKVHPFTGCPLKLTVKQKKKSPKPN